MGGKALLESQIWTFGDADGTHQYLIRDHMTITSIITRTTPPGEEILL